MIRELLDQLRASAGQSVTVAGPAACNAMIDEMGTYLSGDLAGVRRKRFVRHIRNCADCHDKLLVLELALSLDSVASVAQPARDALAPAAAPVAMRVAAASPR